MSRKSGAQPGNRNATKGLPFREALDKALKQGDPNRLRNIAEKLLAMAADGDLEAVKEVANRLDGRPGQRVEIKSTESVADRLMAAEARLKRLRKNPSSEAVEEVQSQNEIPDYLQ
jgi:hypothetical protein